MTAIEALVRGERDIRRAWKMVVFFYLANLVVAMTLALPLLLALDDSLQRSGSETAVLEGFDSDWWVNFRVSHPGWMHSLDLSLVGAGAVLGNYEYLLTGALFELDPLLLGVGFLYWLLQVFLSGGALHILISRNCRFSLIDFIAGCGLYFFRLLRISVLILLILWLLYTVVLAPLGGVLRDRVAAEATERASIILDIFKYLCVGLVLAGLSMVNDYAKIRTVQDGRRSALFAILSAVYLLTRRPRTAVLIYGALLILGIGLVVAYGFVEQSFAVSSAGAVIAAFLLQQLFIGSRVWLKLLFFASQRWLYADYAAERDRNLL